MKRMTAIVVLILLFMGSIIGLPMKIVKSTMSVFATRELEEQLIPQNDYCYDEACSYDSGITTLVYQSDEESDIQIVNLSLTNYSAEPVTTDGSKKKIILKNQAYEEMYVAIDLANAYLSMENTQVATTYTFGYMLKGKMVNEKWFKFISNDETLYISADALMTQEDFLNEYQYVLAQALYSEAGGVGKKEMALVGEVILNRVKTTYWEFSTVHTIEQVLSQKGQYPTTWWKIQNGLEPSEDAMEVAKNLLLGTEELSLTEDTYWQTGFYPTWNVEVILTTQYHWYSKLAT